VVKVAHIVTAGELLDGHTVLDIECLDRIYLNVILSFRVNRGCDLRRPVVGSVLDGTAAA
jgi:hypothetical protein